MAAVTVPAPRPDPDRLAAGPVGARARQRLWWLPAVVLALGLLAAFAPTGSRLSQPLLDAQQRWLAPATPPPGLLVVDIDDASLAALEPRYGPWPFKRDVYALMIEQLRDLGARAVAIDLLLADTHPGDAALARTIGRSGAPVVLSAVGLHHAVDSALPAAARRFAPGTDALPAVAWPAIVLPSESVWPTAGTPPRLGVITSPLDDDGTLRRLPLWHEAQGRRWPALPLAVWQAVHGDASKHAWPLDAEGYARLTFAGPEGAPATVPLLRLARVAGGEEDAGALAALVHDRVVFIGSNALLADSVFTVAGQMDSTAALAQAYAALRDDALLRAPPAWAQALPLALALLPALAIGWRGRAEPAR
ncbi:MAG: CHASE2 domain-containing protein, partial [Burkholderiales bacterium]|nr:CHASE2 domain-containing protein [Burkholderiales bacterium]